MSKEREVSGKIISTDDACNWNLTVGGLKDYDHVYVNGIRYTEYQPDINTQYLLDQVARLTAENAMLKEKWLAQPEQEPAAWMYDWKYEIGEIAKGVYVGSHKASHLYELENLQPLYEREGLTPRQGLAEYKKGYARAETEQEPVAWRGVNFTEAEGDWVYRDFDEPFTDSNFKNVGEALYLVQPKREAIEDGELEVWYSQHTWAMDKQEYIWGFRDAEKAHGIGGK